MSQKEDKVSQKIYLPINLPDRFFKSPEGDHSEVDDRTILKPDREPLKIPIPKSRSQQEYKVSEKDLGNYLETTTRGAPLLDKLIDKIKVEPAETDQKEDPFQILDRDLVEKMEAERQARDIKREERRKKAAQQRSTKESRRIKKIKKRQRRDQKRSESKTLLQKTLNQPVGKLISKTPIIGPFYLKTKEKKAVEQKTKKQSIKSKIDDRIHTWRVARMRRVQKNIVGLEISESTLRTVRIKNNKMTVCEEALPPGIVVDGILEEPEELTEEIKKFWRKNEIDSDRINFSISNRLIKLNIVYIPAKTKEDALQALSMSVVEVISPMQVKKSIIDYQEISRADNSFGFQVVAADRDMVARFISAIEKAGLYAVSCEVGAIAAARSFAIPKEKHLAHALIQVGSETTTISFLNGQEVLFMRNIPIGTRDFSIAIQKTVECSIFEADIMRDQIGIGEGDNTDLIIDPGLIKNTKDSMRLVADRLCQEVAQTRDFFESQSIDRKVGSWSLVGEGARIGGLSEQVGIFSRLPGPGGLDAWPGFEGVSSLESKATAIGLTKEHDLSLIPQSDFSGLRPVLRKQSKINLNESEKAAKELARQHGLVRPKYSPRILGALAAILIFALGFYLKNSIQSQNQDKEAEIAQVKQEVAQNNRSGSTPIYNGPDSAAVESMAGKILVQPNIQLTTDIGRFISSRSELTNYLLSSEGNNYRLEVEFKGGSDVELFQRELEAISNIGTVTVSDQATTSSAAPKLVYLIGGYTGVKDE